MRVAIFELSGLVSGGGHPGIANSLSGESKRVKSPTSARIMAAMRNPQPWDSGDRRMKLIHNGLDLLFDFINFTIQFTDEPDGVLQFKGLGRHLRANRVFGGISYFKSHIPFVVTIGGGFEQCLSALPNGLQQPVLAPGNSSSKA